MQLSSEEITELFKLLVTRAKYIRRNDVGAPPSVKVFNYENLIGDLEIAVDYPDECRRRIKEAKWLAAPVSALGG